MANIAKMRKVKETYVEKLMSLKNVISVGIGKKTKDAEKQEELAIVVGVTEKLPLGLLEPLDLVPGDLDGFKTDVIQIGEIYALNNPRTQRIRPAKGGYSIGNIRISAGTFGCVAHRGEELFLLSNAHVFTPDATQPEATDREILQPGVADGGEYPQDHIANLEDYIVVLPYWRLSDCSTSRGTAWLLTKISQALRRQTRFQAFAQSTDDNLVDAAIARPLDSNLIDPAVEDIGIPDGDIEAEEGHPVVKSGRTTQTTRGTISQVAVEATVGYGSLFGIIPTVTAKFKDQIVIESPGGAERFSDGGDSGSAVFKDDGERKVCGLLFAGNKEGTYTYANRIQNVTQLLNVEVGPP